MDVLNALAGTPVATILIVAGLFFLFLAVGGQFGAKIVTDKVKQGLAGFLGLVLLSVGLVMTIPNDRPEENGKPEVNPQIPEATSEIEPSGDRVQAVCEAYAEQAVNQYQTNVNRQCGFGGPRWIGDFDGHYQWCLKQSEAGRASETDARDVGLLECTERPQRHLNNTNLLWGDIGSSLSMSPTECEQACEVDTMCQAWTWVKQGGLPMLDRPGLLPFCALKNSQDLQRIKDPCCVSGFK